MLVMVFLKNKWVVIYYVVAIFTFGNSYVKYPYLSYDKTKDSFLTSYSATISGMFWPFYWSAAFNNWIEE